MSDETRPPCWVTCGGDELGVCWGEPKCPDFWPGEAIAKRIAELEAEIEEARDIIVDLMAQSCERAGDGVYDTYCISAYESAAEYLVSAGRFVDCNEPPGPGSRIGKVMRLYKEADHE